MEKPRKTRLFCSRPVSRSIDNLNSSPVTQTFSSPTVETLRQSELSVGDVRAVAELSRRALRAIDDDLADVSEVEAPELARTRVPLALGARDRDGSTGFIRRRSFHVATRGGTTALSSAWRLTAPRFLRPRCLINPGASCTRA